ncbi:hypothetical protein E1301_Tti022562 [Triplophysa tibetana]|uniref:Uncharacterized protein n=1 Tax=Triplophysa tibetana TaxID=1572043 RepID=A0A5A9NPD9_9TELE|nr:hypothetical protein E1301_Tti022562 [Triplophysa tibetana]
MKKNFTLSIVVVLLCGVTTHSTPSTHDAEKSFRDARSGKGAARLQCTLQKTDIIKAPFSVAVVVTYVVILFLSLLVLLAISLYQTHRKTSGLRQIIESCISKGDKGGICVVVFYCVVTVLLLLLEVLLFVLTFSYVNNLDLKQMDDTSSTPLAVLFGVLQMLLFLAVIKVYQRISLQKQREICLGVFCLLLLLVLVVVIYTVGFVDLKHMEGHMARLYVVLLVLMVLGVMYHFSENFYLMLKVKQMPAFEGESVCLPIGVTPITVVHFVEITNNFCFHTDEIVHVNEGTAVCRKADEMSLVIDMKRSYGKSIHRPSGADGSWCDLPFQRELLFNDDKGAFKQLFYSVGLCYPAMSVSVGADRTYNLCPQDGAISASLKTE